MPKKETVEIKGTIDLVKQLPNDVQKKLHELKVNGKTNNYSLKISSTQPLIRKAECESVGVKQLHAGLKIFEGIVKQFLVPLTNAKSEKEKQTAKTNLESKIATVNKEVTATYQATMEAHWKKIARAEADAEAAAEKAEQAAKKAEAEAKKNQPKLSNTEWFRLIWRARATWKEFSKIPDEFKNGMKSASLSLAAFANEALRVGSEVGQGTPPEVIKQQREILVSGHAAQAGQHITKLAESARKALDKFETVLDLAKKKDDNLAKVHAKVRNLQFELDKAGKTAEEIKTLLTPFLNKKDALLAHLVKIAKGEVPAKQTLATDLKSQLPAIEEAKFKSLLDQLASAGKIADEINAE